MSTLAMIINASSTGLSTHTHYFVKHGTQSKGIVIPGELLFYVLLE